MNEERMIDEIGEIIDNALKDGEIKMLITFPEGSMKAKVQSNFIENGIMTFYLLMHAMCGTLEDVITEMGIEQEDKPAVIESMLGLLRNELLKEKDEC